MIPVVALLAEPDLDRLNEAALTGLHDIEGCHQLEARVERIAWVGALKDVETFHMTGTLVDGAWQDLAFVPLTDSADGVELQLDLGGGEFPFVPPLLGRLPADRAMPGLKTSLLEDVVDALSGDVASSWVSLDELQGQPAYRLERSIATESALGREIDLWVWVEPDQATARRWQARIPKGIPLGDAMGRLKKVEVVLEVDERGVPTTESLRGTLRMGPLALRLRQSVAYEPATPCES